MNQKVGYICNRVSVKFQMTTRDSAILVDYHSANQIGKKTYQQSHIVMWAELREYKPLQLSAPPRSTSLIPSGGCEEYRANIGSSLEEYEYMSIYESILCGSHSSSRNWVFSLEVL